MASEPIAESGQEAQHLPQPVQSIGSIAGASFLCAVMSWKVAVEAGTAPSAR